MLTAPPSRPQPPAPQAALCQAREGGYSQNHHSRGPGGPAGLSSVTRFSSAKLLVLNKYVALLKLTANSLHGDHLLILFPSWAASSLVLGTPRLAPEPRTGWATGVAAGSPVGGGPAHRRTDGTA